MTDYGYMIGYIGYNKGAQIEDGWNLGITKKLYPIQFVGCEIFNIKIRKALES